MSSIGWNIKDLRERRGLSQEELADMIGKTRSAVSQYESGKIVPRMGVIEDLASAFGVTKDVIINGFAHDDVVSADERELLGMLRQMDEKKRAALLGVARAMLER